MVFMPSDRANDDLRSVIPKKLRFELERKWLLSQLEAASDLQLVALIAPSGYGKTTLLAQFARADVHKAVWLELSEDHADPVVLAHALVGALRVTQPKLSLEHWSQGSQTTSADVLVQLLARDLNRSDENLSFFLDGVHLLGLDASRWLEGLLGFSSEGHRFLIAGYDAQHLPLAKLIAQGQALLFSTQDLAFTLEETTTYLLERNVCDNPDEVQSSLEGWAAGLALVASGMSFQLNPADLMLEALKRLPQAVQAALPEASVCEIWNEEAAARLGCRLPAGWLSVVRQTGLPLTPLGHQTYRPLQVLLEVLQTQLKRNVDRHAELSLNAGLQAQAVGDPMRALKHYRSAQLNTQALDLALKVAPMLFDRAEFRLLRQLLESFEADQLPAELQGFLGIALIETGKGTHGEVLLRKLRSEGQADTQVLYWLGRLAYHEGQLERTLKLAEDGLALQNPDANVSGLLRLKAHALMGLDRQPQALEVMLEAVVWAEDHDNLSELGNNLSSLKLIQYRLGQWFDCEKSILRAMEVYEALGTPVRTLPLLIDLASLRYLQNRANEAFTLIEKGISLGTREQSRLLPYFLELRGDVYFWQQEFELAIAAYQNTISSAQELGDQVLAQIIELKQSEALRRANQSAQASSILKHLSLEAKSNADLQGVYAFYQGIASFSSNAFDAAKEYLSEALEKSEEATHKPRARAYIAEIARQENSLEFEQVKELIASLDAMPHDNVLMVDAEPLHDLFASCIESGWFAERFGHFVENTPTRETPEVITATLQPTFDLEILSLGKLQVSLNGTAIRIPFAKAGELLIFVALHGASSREEIMNALWDGSDENRHHEYFRVAARRLRATLSEHPDVDFNAFPFENKLYSLAPQLSPKLDFGLAQNALESGGIQPLQTALEVYNGEFLPGVNTEWVATIRTRVLEQTVAAAATLGEQLEKTEPREALKIYRRAIELEPLSEVSHLGLIRVHLALGGVAAANQAYGAYARMLSEEFGLQPSDLLKQRLGGLGLQVI
jgi:LuxR family transcriptional regulator, maltose regulon positive regulatory protein